MPIMSTVLALRDDALDNVIHILVGEGGQIYRVNAGQVHVLSLPDRDVVLDPRRDFARRSVATENRQHETPVGHQNLLSGSDGLGQGRVAARDLTSVAPVLVV